MSGDGFHVSTEELRAHAHSVDGVAADVGDAASAAATERAGGLVYGVLFDSIALPFLNLWADQLHGAIAKSASLGHGIATGLRNNVDAYETVEQHNVRTVHNVKDGS